jgi:hypothetical protein
MSIFITSAILKLIQGMVLCFLLFSVRKIPPLYCADTEDMMKKYLLGSTCVSSALFFPNFF